jgi:ribosomal protein L29
LSGFAGVVVGYYFGRVPADARTAQAQEQIGQAVSEMDAMKVERDQAMSTMDDMKKELADLEDKASRRQRLKPDDIRHVREMA